MTPRASVTTELCSITSERIDPEAAKVVRRLVKHDYEAYLVGGCVRDLLVGRQPKDFDVSTSATPTEIKSLFRNSRIIGRRFRLAHIFFGRKIIETATFRAPPQRPADEAEEQDTDLLIRRDNAFGTAEEDALRRDFTINGLFYDLRRHEVIDWVDGVTDLKARRVRTIGDPDVRFQEDPVRILRAVKFASRMDFSIAPATERAMVTHRGLIARCPIARVLEEIYQLLGRGAAEPAFRLMHRLGVLAVLFPELASLLGPPDDVHAAEPAEPICAPHGTGPAPRLARKTRDGKRRPASPTPLMIDSDELLAALELDGAEARARAIDETWKHLAALDQLVQRMRTPPSHPLLLAASVAGMARAAMDNEGHGAGWCIERIDLIVSVLSTRMQISRRDRERLRQMLVAQRRLTQSNPRRQIVHRDYFAESMQLLELRHHATDSLAGAIDSWQDALTQKRRARRSRRGRRGPRHSDKEGLG